ncbi:MAG: hypothetical protein NVS1B2_22990 [Vulcanimicrobiaceae bacterium]
MKAVALLSFGLAAGALVACNGGGSTQLSPAPPAAPAPAAPATTTPITAIAQVVSLALPSTAIGRENDPTFGLVAGYTQQTYSQVLGYPPGMQIMIRNGETTRPHTLGDLGTKSFPTLQPGSLSTVGSATTTFGPGWQSGTINPGQLVGPITLQGGTYYIGCAFHYASDGMRDVLVVAANATPGPQATQPPNAATPAPNSGGGNRY